MGITAFALGVLVAAQAQEVGTVQSDRVNVRGQASLSSEVVAHLKQGDTVNVLGEITLPKPKKGEPLKWLRIQLPPNTPVWISGTFVDPTNKTVSVKRLNLRAGPGENYSVLGRLDKGAVVNQIRATDNWLQIETPTNAYAFVAAEFVTINATQPAPAPTLAETKPVEQPVEKPIEKPVDKTDVPPVKEAPVVPAPAPQPTVTQTPPPVVPATVPAVVPAEVTPAPATPVTEKPVVAAPPAEVKDTTPPPKRVISREGIIRRTVSIQAPTRMGLVSSENGELIDYLDSDKLGIKLDSLVGLKVLVSGEEEMDERWPNTPIVTLDNIRLVP